MFAEVVWFAYLVVAACPGPEVSGQTCTETVVQIHETESSAGVTSLYTPYYASPDDCLIAALRASREVSSLKRVGCESVFHTDQKISRIRY